MEKLIELLNEYDNWWDYDDYYWPYQYWQDRDAYQYGKYYLVSRDYKFIKWLVENDKIDLEKLEEKAERKPQYTFIDDDWRLWFKLFEVYESLLMLLSISDTPIEDLLLYLK